MEKLKFKKNQAIIDTIIDQLSEDVTLKRFFIKHDLTTEMIENHLNDLMTYHHEHPRCLDCQGLDDCSQDTLGYQPVLSYENEAIRLSYQPCHFLRHHQRTQSVKDRIHALYMPHMIYHANLADFYMQSPERKSLYKDIMAFIKRIKIKEPTKGLYLSGEYQIGKTYALAAIANHLAEIGQNVVIAYYPDLVREIKSSIRTGELETIITKLKTIDVLMLDDIGGESPSQWVRDEVLGPILQHRLLDKKITCFTSNIPLKELPKYMVENTQQAEKVKAYRIVERIKHLVDEFRMTEMK